MNFETHPGFEEGPPHRFRDRVQDAVDAVSAAYKAQDIDDVVPRLRSELSNRGVEISDDDWLSEVAGMIRAGLPLVVGEVDEPSTAREEGRHRATD